MPVSWTRLVCTLIVGVGFSMLAASLALYHGRPWALLALLTVPAALVLPARRAAVAVIIGSVGLRLAFADTGYADQLDLAHAAAQRALSGLNPYGVHIDAIATGSPYVYGPLGLVWWLPGPAFELAGAVGTMLLLAHARVWITLSAYAALPFGVYLNLTGVNDYSVGFLILLALLVARTAPVTGAALLAVSIAIKPYAAAWALPVIGYGGAAAALALLIVSLLAWSPVLLMWGPASYIASVVEEQRMSSAAVRSVTNTVNLPIVRWTSVPLELAGLLARRWDAALLVGSAVFVTFLFFGVWASLGYWIVVLPIVGVALEARSGRMKWIGSACRRQTC